MNEKDTKLIEDTTLTVFTDQVGRIIIGEATEQEGSVITIKNPAVVQVTKNEQGNPALGLLPTFYSQLLEDPSADLFWTYNVTTISVLSNASLSKEAKRLYLLTFGKIQSPNMQQAPQTPDTGDEGTVVNLFEQDDK